MNAEKTKSTGQSTVTTTEKITLDLLLNEGRFLKSSDRKTDKEKRAMLYFQSVLEILIADEDIEKYDDFMNFLQINIERLNERIGYQLDEILHHPEYARMEGRWRGLKHLVDNAELSETLKVKLLNIDRTTMENSLLKAIEFDQSKLFKLIYEEGIGTLGGEPISSIILDEYFDCTTRDIEVLTKLSSIAAACHAPLHTSVGSSFFNLDLFTSLPEIRSISNIFSSADKTIYRMFRENDDSKYIILHMPRSLARAKYSVKDNPCAGIAYNEKLDHIEADKMIYMNTAFAMAVCIANSFSLYGWPSAIRGVENGGVAYLPLSLYTSSSGTVKVLCPTEVSLTDRMERELSKMGFSALCYYQNSNRAVFFTANSCYLPKVYTSPTANVNSQMASNAVYVYIAGRFAHLIKILLRNKIGSAMTTDEAERILQGCIAEYVFLGQNGTPEILAAMPLKAAQVRVTEVPGKAGAFMATIEIVPHLNLEEIDVSIRTSARLYTPA